MSDLWLDLTRLLSQQLSKLEPIYQKTACMNPKEREIIGILHGFCSFLDNDYYERLMRGNVPPKTEDQEIIYFLFHRIIPMIEKIGISRWVRGELTDLGLRVGMRHERTIDMGEEVVDVDVSQGIDPNKS